MCNSDNGKCKCLDVKQALLNKVERLEEAAKRGRTLRELNPDIPAEKTISAEQCNWTLKSCVMFRRFIEQSFNECKCQQVIDLMNNDNARNEIKATAQKIANGLGMNGCILAENSIATASD